MPPYCKGTLCKNCIIFYGHLWKGFDEESKEDICSITFLVRYKKRQVISMETNPIQNVYVVKKGLVKTYKSLPGGKQQIIEIIKKEDFLNLNSLFGEYCNHSAETLVDSELCAIEKGMLENLLKKKTENRFNYHRIHEEKTGSLLSENPGPGSEGCSFPGGLFSSRPVGNAL